MEWLLARCAVHGVMHLLAQQEFEDTARLAIPMQVDSPLFHRCLLVCYVGDGVVRVYAPFVQVV